MRKNILNKSQFFRRLKYLLALAVMIIVAVILYFILANQDIVISHKRSQNDEIDKKNTHHLSLKATNPDMIGVSIDHGPYFIQSKEVYEIDKQVMFEAPKIKMMLKHVDWLNLVSKEAKLKVADNHLTLIDGVKANINNEYYLENDLTEILEKEAKIKSAVKTKLFNSEAEIFSDNGFLFDYNNQIIEFFGRVNLDTKKAGKDKSINIKSDSLIGYWKNKSGEFIGNVILNKEKTTVTADKMVVLINDKTKQLEKITAIGNVKVTDNMQTCYGDKGEYIIANSTLTLTGKVKLQRAGNEMFGNSLRYDFNNKRADLTANNNNKERVKAIIIPKKINE